MRKHAQFFLVLENKTKKIIYKFFFVQIACSIIFSIRKFF
jgi:hypothetical protein